MDRPKSEPREGGVKIVFDVPERVLHEASTRVAAAGFDVQRCYRPDDEHRPGGSRHGFVRLGAERAMAEFNDAEQRRIIADFDAVQRDAGFPCERVGVDRWTAGGDDPAGEREPRRPLPKSDAGTAFAEL
jgi:hypothetical protein